jgi:hypothetical protein
MKYFRVLSDNDSFSDRWFLDEPVSADGKRIDAREFRYGVYYQGPIPTNVPIQKAGRDVLFTFAAFDMPVIGEKVARAVRKIAFEEAQYFPVQIDSLNLPFEIMNVVVREICVDESRSEIVWWKANDGRPEKTGKYRMISQLTIDPRRTNDRHIFRVKDWEVALIVSEQIEEAIRGMPDLGVVFESVS